MINLSGSATATTTAASNGGRGRKLSTGWSLAIARFAQYRSRSSRPTDNTKLTETYFDKLPVELLAQIFAQVHVTDLISLQCTSRSFYNIIDVNSALIVRQYIRVHSLTTLSKLFPAVVLPSCNKPRYDVRYIVGLTRREQTCRELSGYLTERILERCLNTPIQRLKPKTRTVMETCLTEELTERMIYVLYFLTEYGRRREQTLERLATHRSLVSSLPTNNGPHPTLNRAEIFRAFQITIISSLSDNILIQTHHIMHLLVKHIRLSVCPAPPHQKNDPWISMLLHKSGLGRITEFFAADMPYASHSTRKAFARAMQKDFDELEEVTGPVSPGGANDVERDVPPPIREIWFDAAQEVLRNRELEPHVGEGLAVGMFGGIVVDDLSCTGCVGNMVRPGQT
ncbi:hypothetical protein H072_1713 [Dactylellina haptotyla CBS 200.50]|uniref:F-box domain-containing protein n=1 Tax=Dactylellina haptotyla (strain CBS 200.50) TaxID=1284197 RepID=S8BXN4_DACHA|nr:hypothetical protein H072_1713 [Dactylellina haptotyla CBS 200.50]